MTDLLRARLAKRAENWNTVKKPPSQKKSETLRKKLARGVDIDQPVGDDCRDCPDHPCGKTLNSCERPSRVRRCPRCGVKVRYRIIDGDEWMECPSCRERGSVV